MHSLFGSPSDGKSHVAMTQSQFSSLLSQQDDKSYCMSAHTSQDSLHQANLEFNKLGNFKVVDLAVGIAVLSLLLFSLKHDFSFTVSLTGSQ